MDGKGKGERDGMNGLAGLPLKSHDKRTCSQRL